MYLESQNASNLKWREYSLTPDPRSSLLCASYRETTDHNTVFSQSKYLHREIIYLHKLWPAAAHRVPGP
jgi:hypothetical protein